MSDYQSDSADTILDDIRSSSLFEKSIFEEKPDLSSIRDNGGQNTITLFDDDKQKIILLDLDVTEKKLNLKLERPLAYFIVKKIHHDNSSTEYSYLERHTQAHQLDLTINVEHEVTQFFTIVFFRSDSVSRLLTQAQTLGKSSSYETSLEVEYVDPNEEPPSGGLVVGAIVGIAVGVLLLIVVVVAISVCLCKNKKSIIKQPEPEPAPQSNAPKDHVHIHDQSIKTDGNAHNPYTQQQAK